MQKKRIVTVFLWKGFSSGEQPGQKSAGLLAEVFHEPPDTAAFGGRRTFRSAGKNGFDKTVFETLDIVCNPNRIFEMQFFYLLRERIHVLFIFKNDVHAVLAAEPEIVTLKLLEKTVIVISSA